MILNLIFYVVMNETVAWRCFAEIILQKAFKDLANTARCLWTLGGESLTFYDIVWLVVGG